MTRTFTLSPGGKRLLRALAAAVIDPGELTWLEAIDRMETSVQSLALIAGRLERLGVVELLEWNGTTYGAIRWTDAGRQLCIEHSFLSTPRT